MIRKQIFQLSLAAIGFVANAQQKPFTISGNFKGSDGAYIYLSYDGNHYDSSLIQHGRFLFKGQLDGPVQAMVMMDRNTRFFDKYAQLFITPGEMQLSVDYKNFSDAVLKGSALQDEADQLSKLRAPLMAKMKPLSDAYTRANTEYINAMKAKKDEATLASLKEAANTAKDAMDPYYEQLRQIDKAFMDQHPASYVTAFTMRYLISEMQLSEAESRYQKLSDAVKNSALGNEIKKEVEALRSGSPGSKAYVFSSQELRGKQLSLADYKGQYVLVDFWASWCVPCRKGNPHLLSLYTKYHDKGFEIISVSDDDNNSEAWQKAVNKDGIGVWKHVLRGLKYNGNGDFDRSNDISDRYGINSLPTKILIDPNGIIIGRYGGGGEGDDAMDKKLSEVFGE